jgi:hypothetical protein
MEYQTLLAELSEVPTPLFALEVHRASIPGQPKAYFSFLFIKLFFSLHAKRQR